MNCPNCQAAMNELTLEAHEQRTVAIDVCMKCQAFWFDKFESLQLAPASTLKLLEMIGEQKAERPGQFEKDMECPRCGILLRPTQDMQRTTRFNYFRCSEHGRFIRFFEFLREKDFIRLLPPQEIAELRKRVQTVNCANCGAPVDLASGSACRHCGTPLCMLDMEQPQRLIAQLKEAATPKPVDPTLPLDLMIIRRRLENELGPVQDDPDWWSDVSSYNLVQACLSSLSRWLKAR